MSKEEDVTCINDCIIKREEAKRKGNEAEVEELTKMLKEKGFEIREDGKYRIGKKKKKGTI